MKKTRLAALPFIPILALAACSSGTSKQPTTPAAAEVSEPLPPATEEPAPAPAADDTRPLYDRLGGLPAITAVIDEFVGRTTTDPRIKDRFFNTDPVLLKKQLVEFVCLATGGPCEYTGRTMEASHGGMEVVEEEWVAVVEALVGALDKFEVGEREKGELLGALGPLKPAIVAPPGSLEPIDAARLAPVPAFAAKLGDAKVAALLQAAVVAGERGQRSYAEQLFTRAEMAIGADKLREIETVFREGAPPRIATAPTKAEETAPQPKAAVGSSEEENAPPEKGSLRGKLLVDGAPVDGLGVIMLTPERGGKKKTPRRGIIEQRDKQFAPRLAAVPVGSTIAFPNFDRIFHNVFSLSKANPFDLGLYKTGEQREVTFDKPGIVRLGCNIHANMAAYVVVVDAPHYVVVDQDGSFDFRRLKPGRYTVHAWTERNASPVVSKITIKPGPNQQTFDLAADMPAGPGPDKFGVARAAPPAGHP